jgi:hypothetical protein
MEVEAAAASAPPAPPRRGRPPEVRCEACDSCRNRQWKKACENKDSLPQRVRIRRGGQAPAPVSASSSSSAGPPVQEEDPEEASSSSAGLPVQEEGPEEASSSSAGPPVQEQGPEEASSSSSSVALAPAPAASSRPEALRVEAMGDDTELRKHLAGLMKIPLAQIGRIRMTPDKQPALVDVISIIARLDKDAAAHYLRRVTEVSPNVSTACTNIHFPGRGQRPTPVAQNLKVLIQVIFLLPGQQAALVRQAAAEVFVRFMGGDLSLIGEVQRIHEVQAFLREHEPDHPMRVFGEAVGSSAASAEAAVAPAPPAPPAPPLRVPPNPIIVRVEDSIGLPGSDHLYAASRLEDNILKIGVSKDVVERMPELSRSFQAGYALQAVWPGEAALEEIVLEKLKPYKATVGSSREHFDARVTLDFLSQMVDHARALYRTKMELAALASSSFEQRKRELEVQEDLKDRALKRRREELALEAERARAELAIEAERAKLQAERAKLEAERAREEVAIQAERAKLEAERAREQLLQKLASANNPQAIKVFLERLSR